METGQTKIRMQLSLMDSGEFLDRVEFEDHELIDAQIDPEAAVDEQTTIMNGESKLPVDFEPSIQHLEFQTGLISGFE